MFSKFFSKAYEKQTVNADLKRAGLKTLLGVRLTKITASYFAIMALGIAVFVIAKKDVEKNRHNLMKIKQELSRLDSQAQYPSRYELIKAEKEAEALKQRKLGIKKSMDQSTKFKSKKNILLGVSGSVATIKLNELVHLLTANSHVNICIVPTKNSLHFLPDFKDFNKKLSSLKERLDFLNGTNNTIENIIFSFTDEDEWTSWQKRSDPVLHIELKKWADIFVIAPLDANTLAKLANGLCDNLLTCIARAWDIKAIKQKPVVVCPAMNTFMYEHPITNRQLGIICGEFGYTIVDCVEKKLMCGDIGLGAMASVETIAGAVLERLVD